MWGVTKTQCLLYTTQAQILGNLFKGWLYSLKTSSDLLNASIKHQPVPSMLFLSLPLSLSACSQHPCLVFICCHCLILCDDAVRLYLHSTRLCESHYRQVVLKDRRTYPHWFRYSKWLHERLGFSRPIDWACSNCLRIRHWCSLAQVSTVLGSVTGYGLWLQLPLKNCCIQTNINTAWMWIDCCAPLTWCPMLCHACFCKSHALLKHPPLKRGSCIHTNTPVAVCVKASAVGAYVFVAVLKKMLITPALILC